ncbi:hypothetical protein LJC58_09975, partial [Lachnospiraceae bacterium OttesenSCG-928-D06]|nr:hypothetical protein [Lachnospiraceae bacterium OttesenSCG-928-D06]
SICEGGFGGSEESKRILEKDLSELPEHVQDIYRRYNEAGWVGNLPGQTQGTKAGGKYKNDNEKLPLEDAEGNSIEYKEWDVNNKEPETYRDGERFVTGSDGSVYYTDSHYGEGTSPSGLPPFIRIR